MIQQYLWYFLIYACLGWMTEVCYAAVTTGKVVNRGFLNGPVCPIYGAGMCFVIWVLSPFEKNPALLFLGAVVLTSLLEGVTGFAMEKLFHQRWWDYSDVPFNIGGYVCLKFSILWGLGCIFVLRVVHTPVRHIVAWLPHTLSTVLLCVLYAVLAADVLATLRTIARLNRQLGEIDDVAQKLHKLSDEMTEDLTENTFAALDKSAGLQQRGAWLKEEMRLLGLEWKADAMERIDEARGQFDEYKENLRTLYETLQGTAELDRIDRMARRQERIDELIARQAALLDRSYFGIQRMVRAFGGMRSTLHFDALEELKRHMK